MSCQRARGPDHGQEGRERTVAANFGKLHVRPQICDVMIQLHLHTHTDVVPIQAKSNIFQRSRDRS